MLTVLLRKTPGIFFYDSRFGFYECGGESEVKQGEGEGRVLM